MVIEIVLLLHFLCKQIQTMPSSKHLFLMLYQKNFVSLLEGKSPIKYHDYQIVSIAFANMWFFLHLLLIGFATVMKKAKFSEPLAGLYTSVTY